jgi:hypothetical protein
MPASGSGCGHFLLERPCSNAHGLKLAPGQACSPAHGSLVAAIMAGRGHFPRLSSAKPDRQTRPPNQTAKPDRQTRQGPPQLLPALPSESAPPPRTPRTILRQERKGSALFKIPPAPACRAAGAAGACRPTGIKARPQQQRAELQPPHSDPHLRRVSAGQINRDERSSPRGRGQNHFHVCRGVSLWPRPPGGESSSTAGNRSRRRPH